jgi:PAS domain S-box-containing protein
MKPEEMAGTGLESEVFRALLEGCGDIILCIDARDGRLVDFNSTAQEHLGYSRDELLGRRLDEILLAKPISTPQQWLARVEQIRRSDKSLFSRGLHRRKDGTTYPVEVNLSYQSHGTRDYIVAVARPGDPHHSQALRQQVFRRVRQVIDGMRGEEDMPDLLTSVRRGLQEMGLRFRNCGVNLAEDGPSPRMRAFTYLSDGTWHKRELSGERIEPFLKLWRTQAPAYRPDLDAVDLYGEKAWLKTALRCLIDIPFPLGSLALSSSEPDAFSSEDIDALIEMAQVLNDGLRRLEDLEQLTHHAARLEQSNSQLENEIEVRRHLEGVQHGRMRVLELMARGAGLEQTLSALVEAAELANPNILASVLLLDEEGKRLYTGAAARLPDFYNEAINGMTIGPGQGSCGTSAHSGSRVVVEDIASHPYWANFREVAGRAGLAACWSEPIVAAAGNIMGTFALYSRQPYIPSEEDLGFSREIARLAAVAIQRQREAADLRQNQVFLQSALANAPLIMWALDLDGVYTLSEGKGLESVGLKPGEVVGRSLYDLYRDYPAFIEAFKRTLEGEELNYTMRFGPGRVWDIHYAPFKDAQGEIIGALGVASNISRQRRQQQERFLLQQVRNEIRRMDKEDHIEKVMLVAINELRQLDIPFDGASVNIIDQSQNPTELRRYIYVNNKISPGRWIRTQSNEATDFTLQVQRGGPSYRPDLANDDPNDERQSLEEGFGHSVLSVLDLPFSHGILAFNSRYKRAFDPEDVTFLAELAEVLGAGFQRTEDLINLRQKEEALRQAQKMEAIGELTAGIAHNFNNILQGIYGNVMLAQEDTAGATRSLLDAAENSVRSAAEMIDQLMMFSRQGGSLRPEPVDLIKLVGRIADICRQTFDRKIAISTQLPSDLPAAMASYNPLEQAFLNLCLNARDAFAGIEDRAPTIHISGALFKNAVPPPQAPPDSVAGPYVCLRFADNGGGMAPETLRRIFDPFFTTKEKGTGLGLSTVFGMVADSGGWIECDSVEGKGTTFSIYLRPTEDSETLPIKTAAPMAMSQGVETVLIIDDEDAVRLTLVQALKRLGYDSLEAADGEAGLELLRQHPEVKLILLDMSMPRMSGAQVLDIVRAEKHPVKVICITGGSQRDCPDGVDGLVTKPFSLDLIGRSVRQVLDAPDPGDTD